LIESFPIRSFVVRRRARRALDVRTRAIAPRVSTRRRPPRASPTPRDDARGETH
jgi:hypothetical protein